MRFQHRTVYLSVESEVNLNRKLGIEIEFVAPIIGRGSNHDVQELLAQVLTNHGIQSCSRGYTQQPLPHGYQLAVEHDASLHDESRYRGLSWSKLEVKTSPMLWDEVEKEIELTTTSTVGSGKYTYTMDENWAKVPDGWAMPAAAVYGDSQDRVYCFNRDPDHPICIFDRDGNFLSSWGAGSIAFAHAIYLDKEDNVWLVDRNHHQVYKYTKDGQLLMTIGEEGFRSDTGVAPDDYSSATWSNVNIATLNIRSVACAQ